MGRTAGGMVLRDQADASSRSGRSRGGEDGGYTREPGGLKIAVFFSHGMSLRAWEESGLFEREVGYYRELMAHVGSVLLVTYDTRSESVRKIIPRLNPICARYNRWGLSYRLFGLVAPLVLYNDLKGCDLFRTNQLSGAWTAVLAQWILRKPLVVRCGFVRSSFMRMAGAGPVRLFIARVLEKVSVRAADAVFVATDSDRLYLVHAHGVPPERISVLPNAIDTDVFRPLARVRKEKGLVLYVGRLVPQKNVEVLVEACRNTRDVRLVIAGNGPSDQALREMARGLAVEMRGSVLNAEVPVLLNEAEVFVLPSHYEGSPKALLEAMACGSAVIGTDAPGIRGLIEHEVTGLLCEATADALRAAIVRVLGDRELRDQLGRRARAFVTEHHSMMSVTQRESRLLRELIARRTHERGASEREEGREVK